jgi:hypothetical protein
LGITYGGYDDAATDYRSITFIDADPYNNFAARNAYEYVASLIRDLDEPLREGWIKRASAAGLSVEENECMVDDEPCELGL